MFYGKQLQVENVLLRQNGDYVLCDYGSCCLDTLIPEVRTNSHMLTCNHGNYLLYRRWEWHSVKTKLKGSQHWLTELPRWWTYTLGTRYQLRVTYG